MKRYASLAGFLVLVVGGGLLIGLLNVPGEWYAGLRKPPFNPPNWVFGPAWTTLYVLIAIAGWRSWTRRSANPRAMTLWWAQLFLNFLWSPAFFGLQQPILGLVVIVPLLGVVLAYIASTWRSDRVAAILFFPYALWVAFATLLNASIVWLN